MDRVSDFLKNLIMFLVICFLVSLFFNSSSNESLGFPKVYCLSSVKAAQSSRMCIAVSVSSVSLQKSHFGLSASFARKAWLLRLLCPVRIFVRIAVSCLSRCLISLIILL